MASSVDEVSFRPSMLAVPSMEKRVYGMISEENVKVREVVMVRVSVDGTEKRGLVLSS